MTTQQDYIQTLIQQQDTKLSLEAFFKDIHSRFYPSQDVSFMDYFLELTAHEGEFVVHHKKLVKYGVMSSKQSNHVKVKLDALGLVEDEEYHLLPDVREPVPQGGYSTKKVYMLTPEAFKKCLMRAQRRPKQAIDPVVYCDYYLLLERTYKLYTDYEKQLLNRQLEQNKQTIEQKDHQLDQKDKLVLRLNEMLIDSSSIPKTQVVYIATSPNYAQQNRFKVGGVESLEKLSTRLTNYNGRSATGDMFYYADWFQVHNYREIENRLKDLLGRFRDSKLKEIYVLHYTKLEYIIRYLVQHYNDETDCVNSHLMEFISSLDTNELRPHVPTERCLKQIKISEVGHPTIIIQGSTDYIIEQQLEAYFRTLNTNTTVVRSKEVFDSIQIKKGRLGLYGLLTDIGKRCRPDVVIKKR